MRTSRRELEARNRRQTAQIDRLTKERDDAQHGEYACASQLERIAGELSRLKDEVALHIVAAKHPSSEASSAHAMAVALTEAFEAHGVDLRLELARLEGSDL